MSSEVEYLHEAFSRRVKTRVREDFRLLLCDTTKCNSKHMNMLKSILVDNDGHLKPRNWKEYLGFLLERRTDSVPQLLRIVNKALEVSTLCRNIIVVY